MSSTLAPVRGPRSADPARRERPHWGRRILIGLILVPILLVGACAASVVFDGRQYDDTHSDAIVVLGASQYWGEPSPVLANRLDYALELYREGVADRIITVGGSMPTDNTTEAQAGSNYLEKQGVPARALVTVPQGRDTIGSMKAVARVAGDNGWDTITIVSDRAHLARSKAIAQGLGLHTHVSGPAIGDGARLTPEYVGRESLGLLRFYLWDRWHLLGAG